MFIFDGGTLDDDTVASLTVTDPEIADYHFAAVTESATVLRPDVHRRLLRAHQALLDGATTYEEHERTW